MIKSMTAFGTGQSTNELLTINVDLRSVNSRYLDINIRLPEDLRHTEPILREIINKNINRGKVELRLNYAKAYPEKNQTINPEYLKTIANQLNTTRQFLPETPSPSLFELLHKPNEEQDNDTPPETWLELSQTACKKAIEQLVQARLREGQRLAQFMLEQTQEILEIVAATQEIMPKINQAYQEKINTRIQDSLNAICPDGFENISGSELSARIAQESSLFALRGDVEEELTRIKSHVRELQDILGHDINDTSNDTNNNHANTDKDTDLDSNSGASQKPNKAKKTKSGNTSSIGKRIDFLCQELNREANTLGSKASGMQITNAAIDLKLLIEQLREQAQNIE